MNAFQLSSTQTFRQGFTIEPIGLHPLSWSSGDHRWSGDQAPIPLSRKPIIQPVPCGSSLIGKGHLLIRKVVVYMVQQVLHFIRHAQGSDESLMTAKSCRDALLSTSKPANTSYSRGTNVLSLIGVPPSDNAFCSRHCTRALVSRTDIPHTSLSVASPVEPPPKACENDGLREVATRSNSCGLERRHH